MGSAEPCEVPKYPNAIMAHCRENKYLERLHAADAPVFDTERGPECYLPKKKYLVDAPREAARVVGDDERRAPFLNA